jgi:hypothetical protein
MSPELAKTKALCKSLPPLQSRNVNAKPAGDIRLEKYLLLGGRFERNGLG